MNEYVHAIRAGDPAVAWMLSGANGSRKGVSRSSHSPRARPARAATPTDWKVTPTENRGGCPRRSPAGSSGSRPWRVHVHWTWSPRIRESEPAAGRDRRCHAPPRVGLAEQFVRRIASCMSVRSSVSLTQGCADHRRVRPVRGSRSRQLASFGGGAGVDPDWGCRVSRRSGGGHSGRPGSHHRA